MCPIDQTDLDKLEAVLGHCFQQRALLIRALTHSSLAYEKAGEKGERSGAEAAPESAAPEDADNEQLEFLGDAVVGLLVAEFLCKAYPELAEGQLTRLRAALVSRRHLGEVAAGLDLGDYMRLGRGEERSGGRKKNALLANCIEAVIGALYLDGGIDPVRRFAEGLVVSPYVARLHEELEQGNSIGDHKSALQEFLQARHLAPPQYAVKSESGPDHRKRFVVEVRVPASDPGVAPNANSGAGSGANSGNSPIASGIGTTKKKAEQEAARRAFDKLRSGDLVRNREANQEPDRKHSQTGPESAQPTALQPAASKRGDSRTATVKAATGRLGS